MPRIGASNGWFYDLCWHVSGGRVHTPTHTPTRHHLVENKGICTHWRTFAEQSCWHIKSSTLHSHEGKDIDARWLWDDRLPTAENIWAVKTKHYLHLTNEANQFRVVIWPEATLDRGTPAATGPLAIYSPGRLVRWSFRQGVSDRIRKPSGLLFTNSTFRFVCHLPSQWKHAPSSRDHQWRETLQALHM